MTESETTEKITINLNVVELGQIDLLVQEGFYANRTDFLRAAVRELIGLHRETLHQAITRRAFVLGILSYNRKALEDRRREGVKLDIKVIGSAIIAKDVEPELALDTIESLEVHGVLQISPEVRQALGSRIKS